jgi:hypothetical protein
MSGSRGCSYLFAALAIVAAYLVLSIGCGLSRIPFCDEAWLATPGANLIYKGHLGTSNLETAGTWAEGMDRYTYWVMPLHLLAQAAWYSVFDFSLRSLRLLSTAWGLVALAAWFVLIRSLDGRTPVALLASAFVAVDYFFVGSSATGRMDMMAAALGYSAWAVYVAGRQRNVRWALFAAHVLIAASLFTHPYGLGPAMGLAALILIFDRRSVTPRNLALWSVPYLTLAAGWGLYILQAPELFLTQFRGNSAAGGRFSAILSPFEGIRKEILSRYLISFGWNAGGFGRFRLLILAAYAAGIGGFLFTRHLSADRLRVLGVLAGIQFFFLTLFEGKKSSLYLVYITPVLAAVTAIYLSILWRRGSRFVVATAAATIVLIQAGGGVIGMRRNSYGRLYVPVAAMLKEQAHDGGLIMGPATLGFALGFHDRLIDDHRLGFYSGKQPEIIVIDEDYRFYQRRYAKAAPEIDRHVRELLSRYSLTYQNAHYQVYRRRAEEKTGRKPRLDRGLGAALAGCKAASAMVDGPTGFVWSRYCATFAYTKRRTAVLRWCIASAS